LTTPSRYALLTVDTEALPRRASQHHIQRLVWGQHERGTAGIREITAIGSEFSVEHVFFLDLCAEYDNEQAWGDVVTWLAQAGQDIQLHTHPEVLPKSFWQAHGMRPSPRQMNRFADSARAELVIRHFSERLSGLTGKPVLAYRAGSFRWNAHTLRALQALGIPLSFNNSMRARVEGRCSLSQRSNHPFMWSNGVVEVPVTERRVFNGFRQPERWVSLAHPPARSFRRLGNLNVLGWPLFTPKPPVAVFLLHSWSLLERDENGHAVYRNDALLEAYRRTVARIVKDYDVITTSEFLDLLARGKITPSHTVGLE